MEIVDYGHSQGDHKLYEGTQIRIAVSRTTPGRQALILSFTTSDPDLAQLATGGNPSQIKIYVWQVTCTPVYFILQSDGLQHGTRNVTFAVSSTGDAAEPGAQLGPLEVLEHDGRSLAMELAQPGITEGQTLRATLTRNFQDGDLSVQMGSSDFHPPHLTLIPNPIEFRTGETSKEFEIVAEDNRCFDAGELTLAVTATALGQPAGRTLFVARNLHFYETDVAQVNVEVVGNAFLAAGQSTLLRLTKNFYDPLTIHVWTAGAAAAVLRFYAEPPPVPATATPITVLELAMEQMCVVNGRTLTAVVASDFPSGAAVDVYARAEIPTKTGWQNWTSHVVVTITTPASPMDNSPFSAANLPSTIGSGVAGLALIVVLVLLIRYLRNRRKQPASSFGRFNDEVEGDTTGGLATASKFTIADNENAQGYLTGNTDQLLSTKEKDDRDIELSSKIGAAVHSSASPSADSSDKAGLVAPV